MNGTFIPPNDEYQNYGIMAAIDHINALKDIMKKFPQFQTLPKIYEGGLMEVILHSCVQRLLLGMWME